jgi:hypothetical protein
MEHIVPYANVIKLSGTAFDHAYFTSPRSPPKEGMT